jgi:hypothetical protein
MPLNNSALQVAGAALATDITHLAIHTAAPNIDSGTNASAAARQPVTWSNTNGDLTASNIAFTGGAASGPATYVGFWTASTGGTFRGFLQLTGDTTFNAAGEYTITSITLDGSAS